MPKAGQTAIKSRDMIVALLKKIACSGVVLAPPPMATMLLPPHPRCSASPCVCEEKQAGGQRASSSTLLSCTITKSLDWIWSVGSTNSWRLVLCFSGSRILWPRIPNG